MPAVRKKTRKKIYLVSFIFLLIAAGLYVLYNTRPVKLTEDNDFKGKNAFEQTISEAINISRHIFEGTKILKNVTPFEICPEGKYCIQYENRTNTWYAASDPSFEVNLTDRYGIKLTMRGEEDFAGINLIGQYSEKGKEWWDGRKSLNIYVLYDNIQVYADTGFARDPMLILSDKAKTDDNGNLELLLIFDQNGKNVTIAKITGEIINTIDISQTTSGNISAGIFPGGKFSIGTSISPSAKLTVLDFLGFPLDDKLNQ